jgi:hypothetical protein
MRYLLFMLLAGMLAGCSGMPLKKCVGDIPENYMSCPNHISGDFYKCEKISHGCQVVEPQ